MAEPDVVVYNNETCSISALNITMYSKSSYHKTAKTADPSTSQSGISADSAHKPHAKPPTKD